METAAIILAAGAGTRMKSKRPKVAHEVLGRPLVQWAVRAAEAAGADRIVTVVGHGREAVIPLVEDDTQVVVQTSQRGTADAVLAAADALADFDGAVVVLSGDSPLIRPETIREMCALREAHDAAVVVLTMDLANPFGYGRIVRDGAGEVERIVEQKDASPEEAAITECNSGFYCFDGRALFEALAQVGSDNAQGEFYLTDVLAIARAAGRGVLAYKTDDAEQCLGVNSRGQLAEATRVMQRRINDAHMAAGVTMWDPATTFIGPDVDIASDVELLPAVILMGDTSIGEDSVIGMSVENAVSKITQLSVELGYINEDNKVVQTSVSASANAEKLQSKINAQITATATGLDMEISCSVADAYSLLRKLENVKAQYPDNEKIQAMTPQQFKLVISASETGEITIEAAAELNTQQLVKLVTEAHKNAEQFATDAYLKAKTAANDAYDKAVGAAIDGIYTSYYMAHHPMNAYYGLAYQGYKTSARGLNALADTLDFIEDVCDYPLDEAQISAISQALGLGDNVDALKNSDGEITVKSVEAYADKTFKNTQASQELEAMKAQLTAALSDAENVVQQKINELSKEYEPQISAVTATINTALNGLEAFIPAGILPQIQQMQPMQIRYLY